VTTGTPPSEQRRRVGDGLQRMAARAGGRARGAVVGRHAAPVAAAAAARPTAAATGARGGADGTDDRARGPAAHVDGAGRDARRQQVDDATPAAAVGSLVAVAVLAG